MEALEPLILQPRTGRTGANGGDGSDGLTGADLAILDFLPAGQRTKITYTLYRRPGISPSPRQTCKNTIQNYKTKYNIKYNTKTI